jgi:hypothetical protein
MDGQGFDLYAPLLALARSPESLVLLLLSTDLISLPLETHTQLGVQEQAEQAE